MKKILLITMLIISLNAFAQHSSLIGKWETVEVHGARFSVGRNDSIQLYDNYKRNKVSTQDAKAFVRIDYANNIFVFAADGGFKYYKNENPRTLTFVGTYTLENQNIILKVKNPANIEVNKKAAYYFENGELHLKMNVETNSPIDHILRRVED